MSNFPSYMALGMSSATYARVADLEYNVTQLADALIYELEAIHGTLADSLDVQQALLNREIFQANLEEFVYQLERSVQEVENLNPGESPVTHFFRLSYFLNTVDQEQINTSIIKGRDNKAAFDRAVSRANELCSALRTNGEVIAAIAEIEREEDARKKEDEAKKRQQEEERRLRVLREEKERRRARGIIIAIVATILVLCIVKLVLESENWPALNLRLRAYMGSADAQKTAAQKYYQGLGVVRDYQESLRWFQKAAEGGDKDSQYQSGLMYYRGEGVARDYSNALKWFQKAAEQGNEEALKQTNLLSSFLTTKEKAEQGDRDAQYRLGLMYYKGEGISKDFREALAWLQKASSQDHAAAQTYLGAIYLDGEGVPKDYSEAFKWFQKAAEQGNEEAKYQIGLMYYWGEGVTHDYKAALKWVQEAADQGSTNALRFKDGFSRFIRTMEKADLGDVDAQFSVAQMYWRGQLVCQDYSEVLKWAKKAANRDHAEAQTYLGGNSVPTLI